MSSDTVQKNELITRLANLSQSSGQIENALYEKYKVYRGLRDKKGVGVVTGLTEVSEMNGYAVDENGERKAIEGEMFYRGYNINDLVADFKTRKGFAFEETVYLLLCGELPTKKELADFCTLLADFRTLPESFVRDVILKAPSTDLMNALSRSVLTLYSYDDKADDVSIRNVFRQCLQLIAELPLLAVYSYEAYRHYHLRNSLVIRYPKPEYSTAENILYMLHGTGKYTEEQVLLLDLCMVLQAEHGGGNNSTFTTYVVTSTGTDTYSAVAASLGSLKGPRHGGANLRVAQMVDDLKRNIAKVNDEEIVDYLNKILDKDAFDRMGLIYGLGHAVYSLSDPRALILKNLVDKYNEVYHDPDADLYERLWRLAPKTFMSRKKDARASCINIDFYTGYIYRLIKIPDELFTPLFAVSRLAGWSAHRLEALANGIKIIRPAYIAVSPRREYVCLSDRKDD